MRRGGFECLVYCLNLQLLVSLAVGEEECIGSNPMNALYGHLFFPFQSQTETSQWSSVRKSFFGSILCRRQGTAGTTVLNAWITIQADCVLFQTMWPSVICLCGSPGVFLLLLLYSAIPSVKQQKQDLTRLPCPPDQKQLVCVTWKSKPNHPSSFHGPTQV